MQCKKFVSQILIFVFKNLIPICLCFNKLLNLIDPLDLIVLLVQSEMHSSHSEEAFMYFASHF